MVGNRHQSLSDVLLDSTVAARQARVPRLVPGSAPGKQAVVVGAASMAGSGQDRLHRVGLSLADHAGDILAGVPIVRATA
jgi:hypothetical protein